MQLENKLMEFLANGIFQWPQGWEEKYPALVKVNVPTLLQNKKDRLYWIDNQNKKVDFLVRNVWNSIREVGVEVHWWKLVWFSSCIPKHAFMLRLVFGNRLKMQDRMKYWDGNHNSVKGCLLCGQVIETHQHLFFECAYSKNA